MNKGSVLALYMTTPDLMRKGHRVRCESLEYDSSGIIGDINYEKEEKLLLVSKNSYEIIENAGVVVDLGLLMENIYVDIDINTLKSGESIKIGDYDFSVDRECRAYSYLYAISPELPSLIEGKRGIFITSKSKGIIKVGDEVSF